MSLIESIFGTTAPETTTTCNTQKPHVNKSRVQTNSTNEAVTSTRRSRGISKNATDDNTDKNGQNTNTNTTSTMMNSSLFQTVIPIPDRTVQEYRTTKRPPATTTTSHSPSATKRQKYENDEVCDHTQHSTMIGPSPQPKQTADDEERDKNERTIFVGNIPITYTRKHLRQLFLDCCKNNGGGGTIQSTRIRGIAMKSSDSSNTTTEEKHGTSGTEKKTKPDKGETTTSSSSIKLPPALAGQQQVYKKVCVNTSQNMIDTSKKQSNIGYVVFTHRDSVENAIRQMNNRIVPVSIPPPPFTLSSLSATTTSSSSDTTNSQLLSGGDVRHLRVDRLIPIATTTTTTDTTDTTTVRDPKRTIFIGNLPYHTDEETLHQHILQHMNITNNNKNDSKSTTNNDCNTTIIESIRVVRNPTTYVCQGFAYVLFTSIQSIPIALQTLHQTTYMKQSLRIQICKNTTKTSSRNSNGGGGGRRNSHSESPPSHSIPTSTTMTSPTIITTRTTKAVGALKRVLQKQQRLLVTQSQQSNVKTKTTTMNNKTIRKRGPTSSKQKTSTTGTKRKTSTTTKKKKK